MKIGFLLFTIISLLNSAVGQRAGIEAEALGSFFFVSQRHATENGEQDIYGEIRVGYRASRILQVNTFIGRQKRSFIYYAQFNNPWQLVPLFMDRVYRPIGVNARLHITDFFYEKWKLFRRKGRWEVYNQVGIALLTGRDEFDPRHESFRGQGAYVPYYVHPYVEEYGKVYFIFLAGLKFNFNENIGILAEAGDGALMSLQIGVSASF